MSDRPELYRSSSGDAWFLDLDPSGAAVVIHEANRPSGGKVTSTEIGVFLGSGNGPEQQALLRLIGTLVETAPDRDDVAPCRWRVDVMLPQDDKWNVHSYFDNRAAAFDRMDHLDSARVIEEKVVAVSSNSAATSDATHPQH
jgi:hypothetical protein